LPAQNESGYQSKRSGGIEKNIAARISGHHDHRRRSGFIGHGRFKHHFDQTRSVAKAALTARFLPLEGRVLVDALAAVNLLFRADFRHLKSCVEFIGAG
jgi:hypothetical protein